MSVIDYNLCTEVVGFNHSGDLMDDVHNIGHHLIKINLDSIPKNITACFFTLSAWNCPTIEHFPNPSLSMFDSNNVAQQLCNYCI